MEGGGAGGRGEGQRRRGPLLGLPGRCRVIRTVCLSLEQHPLFTRRRNSAFCSFTLGVTQCRRAAGLPSLLWLGNAGRLKKATDGHFRLQETIPLVRHAMHNHNRPLERGSRLVAAGKPPPPLCRATDRWPQQQHRVTRRRTGKRTGAGAHQGGGRTHGSRVGIGIRPTCPTLSVRNGVDHAHSSLCLCVWFYSSRS